MQSQTYRGAIFREAGKVDIVDLPYPKCGDDEVIVKNLLAGVCGSDVSSFIRGGDLHMVWRDHEFGHEAISEVVEIGKDVKGLNLGDHVFLNQGYALRDLRRMATVGSFSEYVRVPQCEVGYSLFKIDNDIPVKTGVLLEPFVIGSRGARNLNPGPDKTAIVFGAGIIGMSAAIMLKWYGCSKVMVVDISDLRLENAKNFGLLTCNTAKEDLKTKAYAEFGSHETFVGERCSATSYLDACGLKVAIDNFKELACREASLAIVGAHHQPVDWDLRRLSQMNWVVTGCGSTPIEELVPDVLALMKSRRFNLSSLVTHEFDVEHISEALVLGGKSQEAQKVCIRFGA